MGKECIIAIVERGKASLLTDVAKKAGAGGATIIYGRGTSTHEAKKFLNINVDPSKELVFIIADESEVDGIVDAMAVAGHLDVPGMGIIFTFPISHVRGLRSSFDEE